jgi:hypothetical protein
MALRILKNTICASGHLEKLAGGIRREKAARPLVNPAGEKL